MAAQEKIVKISTEVKEKLTSLGIEEQLVSEIEWCLGSYAADNNPVGLFEKAEVALASLQEVKKTNPRKVSKKLIDDLSKLLLN